MYTVIAEASSKRFGTSGAPRGTNAPQSKALAACHPQKPQVSARPRRAGVVAVLPRLVRFLYKMLQWQYSHLRRSRDLILVSAPHSARDTIKYENKLSQIIIFLFQVRRDNNVQKKKRRLATGAQVEGLLCREVSTCGRRDMRRSSGGPRRDLSRWLLFHRGWEFGLRRDLNPRPQIQVAAQIPLFLLKSE